MGYYEDYSPDRIKINVVPCEGIYQVKIVDVVDGTMPKDGKRYTQVKCVINAEGYPQVSIFLTEGPNFNGNLTAFFDTFGIQRGNFQKESWKDKKGKVKITLAQKNGYTNMTPHFLFNEDGWVVRDQQPAPAAVPQMQQQNYGQTYDSQGIPEDIPF